MTTAATTTVDPDAALSAAETHRFAELVESLPDSLTLVIVEHDLEVVYRLADRISVLAAGTISSGTSRGSIALRAGEVDHAARRIGAERAAAVSSVFGAPAVPAAGTGAAR